MVIYGFSSVFEDSFHRYGRDTCYGIAELWITDIKYL